MTELKALLVEFAAAREYSIGLMLPRPEAPRYWLSRVTMPAKTGLDTDVPPKMEQGPVPFTQAVSILVIPAAPPEQMLVLLVPPSSLCAVQTM
jgi:hypothetical protein